MGAGLLPRSYSLSGELGGTGASTASRDLEGLTASTPARVGYATDTSPQRSDRRRIQGMRRIRWLVVGIALTALLSATALAATKGIKISQRAEDFTATSEVDEELVDCGEKRAVSGGFFGEVDPPGAVVLPLVSARQKGSELIFRAANLVSGEGDATVYAYCANKDKFPRLRPSSEERETGMGTEESVTADCPGNRRAISGGFALPDQLILVTASKRSGKGSWTVEFLSGTPEQLIAEVFVYCAKRVKLKRRSSETNLPPNEGPVTGKARCRRKQRVVSGGFDTGSSGIGFASASRRAGKRAWEVTATAETLNPQELTVFAYCLKRE
jgi:hypothetical protein